MCEQDLFKNTGKYRANRCSVTPTRHRHPRNIWHAKYLDISAIQIPAVWNEFWLKNTSAMTYSKWESKIQSGKFGEELSQDYTTGFLAGFCCRRQIFTVCEKKNPDRDQIGARCGPRSSLSMSRSATWSKPLSSYHRRCNIFKPVWYYRYAIS